MLKYPVRFLYLLPGHYQPVLHAFQDGDWNHVRGICSRKKDLKRKKIPNSSKNKKL